MPHRQPASPEKQMTKSRFNYGWVIAITCFLIFFTIVGINVSPTNLFIVPVTEHFGFSRGDFSITFTLVTIVSMLIQLVYGVFEKRIGVRGLVSIGAILAPIGFLINARAASLAAFYTAGVIIGISFAFISITSMSIIINNWFKQRQGFLLGVISSGSGFGGGFFSIIIGNHMERYGFRSAYLLGAIIMAAVAVPVILLIRSKPDDKQRPLASSQTDKGPKSSIPVIGRASVPVGQFFKSPQYVLPLLSVFIIGVAFHPVLVSMPAYLVEKGFDAVFAAGVTGAVFFVLGGAKIIIGALHDKLGIKTSLLITVSAFVLSAVLLILAAQAWLVWIFIVFHGISLTTIAVLVPLYAKEILGNENYSRYLGVFVAVLSIGAGIGIPIINYIFDLTGSYTGTIAAFAALAAAGLIVAIIPLQSKSLKER
jgi:MFS transporter, OFA family, oxalate/formate antiporter